MNTYSKYMDYVDYEMIFSTAIDMQIMQLINAMTIQDAGLYKPIMIR